MTAVTVRAAALELAVSTETVRRWLREGAPCVKPGGHGPGQPRAWKSPRSIVGGAAITARRSWNALASRLWTFYGVMPAKVCPHTARSGFDVLTRLRCLP